jgi:hypothetical protein
VYGLSFYTLSFSGVKNIWGPVLHSLKNNIEKPLNTVLIVSWHAPHSLGRWLADRENEGNSLFRKFTVSKPHRLPEDIFCLRAAKSAIVGWPSKFLLCLPDLGHLVGRWMLVKPHGEPQKARSG